MLRVKLNKDSIVKKIISIGDKQSKHSIHIAFGVDRKYVFPAGGKYDIYPPE